MFFLAWQNLKQNQERLWLSACGIGLALSLILTLDSVMAGLENQLTAYIESTSADVWVAQKGVKNLHMTHSSLSQEVIAELNEIPGVMEVSPILYTTQMMALGEERYLNYVIGVPENATMGGPARLLEGHHELGPRELVLDQQQAYRAGIQLADEVRLFGRAFKVTGLTSGLTNAVNGVVFIAFKDFAAFRRTKDTVSYLLLKVDRPEQAERVASTIEAELTNVSAFSRARLLREERQVLKDMGFEAINIMNSISFAIGLAVLGLSIYLITISKRTEFGVLRALGIQNTQLVKLVLIQAMVLMILGYAFAVVATLLLSLLMSSVETSFNLQLDITGTSLLKTAIFSLIIASLSAIAPLVLLSKLDPMLVFRGDFY